jgi:hypothetical protein
LGRVSYLPLYISTHIKNDEIPRDDRYYRRYEHGRRCCAVLLGRVRNGDGCFGVSRRSPAGEKGGQRDLRICFGLVCVILAFKKRELSILLMFTYSRRIVPVIPPKCVKSIKTRSEYYTCPGLGGSVTKTPKRARNGGNSQQESGRLNRAIPGRAESIGVAPKR